MKRSILDLNSKQQKVYDKILSSIKAGRCYISLPAFSDLDEAFDIFKLVLGDYPEFFYYDNCRISTSGLQMHAKELYGVIEKFRKIEKFNLESNEIINSVISYKMSEAQKVLAIHNYLSKNVQYNSTIRFSKFSNELHTAYGAIVNKIAVCEGIACAFAHLLHLCGIGCSIVNGNTDKTGAEGHSWNIVNIDNNYFHVDVTWDIETNGGSDGICFDYFGLTDSDLSSRRWKKFYPACNFSNYNYFRLSNSVANNDIQLCEIANRQFQKNGRVYLKYTYLNKRLDDNQISDYVFDLLRKNKKLRKYLIGKFTCRVNDDQKIILIEGV